MGETYRRGRDRVIVKDKDRTKLMADGSAWDGNCMTFSLDATCTKVSQVANQHDRLASFNAGRPIPGLVSHGYEQASPTLCNRTSNPTEISFDTI